MMAPSLSMWTVYQNPSDFPGKFVARRFEVPGTVTAEHVVADTLGEVQALLPPDLICMSRMPHDDPAIVEVWF